MVVLRGDYRSLMKRPGRRHGLAAAAAADKTDPFTKALESLRKPLGLILENVPRMSLRAADWSVLEPTRTPLLAINEGTISLINFAQWVHNGFE